MHGGDRGKRLVYVDLWCCGTAQTQCQTCSGSPVLCWRGFVKPNMSCSILLDVMSVTLY